MLKREIRWISLFHFLSLRREEYQDILTYSIPAENIRWSTVFGIMENAKKTLKIEDYSVSQNSLEQVVLMLVKDQQGPRFQK